jgi:hypothetical protein
MVSKDKKIRTGTNGCDRLDAAIWKKNVYVKKKIDDY